MSNPRAKPIPPPTKTSNRSPAPKNPPTKKPAPKPPAKSPSGPTKPVPAGVRSNPTKNPTAKPAEPAPTGNWINRTVQNSVAGVGNYAGSLITGVGNSVNKVGMGVGERISDTTRGWGQGVAGYGNDIKDSVGVGGPRVATGGNPLGLAGQGSSKNMPLPASKTKSAAEKNKAANNPKTSAVNPLGI
ncbi:unnamed protein product [Zymoseptoria tritici ST99CH_1A5]|uniref:Uncharacterized protein n=3 Tax=Zymoseptoria tritici TaxID=1047171 RepID=F9XCB3_ZYMTI|nr:uncharacterized protein MYCGRDRAFT_104515 [Zymoseptoria tritici IPO323]EGP87176.1 hypothetical protein MYCGRDRAFT_104515 [Zymoseptoria tritici IPO323]SMQ50856.1 unnamed protein product [Zymoseptoria tritici ST99CH_3D7]SMY24522.1 unnamed protein product [Zymoseptoria tritici ST99CH_1A5]